MPSLWCCCWWMSLDSGWMARPSVRHLPASGEREYGSNEVHSLPNEKFNQPGIPIRAGPKSSLGHSFLPWLTIGPRRARSDEMIAHGHFTNGAFSSRSARQGTVRRERGRVTGAYNDAAEGDIKIMSIREEINLSDSGAALFFHSFRKLQLPERSLNDNTLGESRKLNESLRWWGRGNLKFCIYHRKWLKFTSARRRRRRR